MVLKGSHILSRTYGMVVVMIQRSVDSVVHQYFVLILLSLLKVPIDKLSLCSAQLVDIGLLYSNNVPSVTRRTFGGDTVSQGAAKALLIQHGLDPSSREQLESKWSVVWCNTWSSKAGEVVRLLLQWYLTIDELLNQYTDFKQ